MVNLEPTSGDQSGIQCSYAMTVESRIYIHLLTVHMLAVSDVRQENVARRHSFQSVKCILK